MEFGLKFTPQRFTSRNLPTNNNSMADRSTFFPLTGHMEQPPHPSKSWWPGYSPQIKFPFAELPKFDVMGGKITYVVGGFVGSKSQRSDDKQSFPIGKLISHCIAEKLCNENETNSGLMHYFHRQNEPSFFYNEKSHNQEISGKWNHGSERVRNGIKPSDNPSTMKRKENLVKISHHSEKPCERVDFSKENLENISHHSEIPCERVDFSGVQKDEKKSSDGKCNGLDVRYEVMEDKKFHEETKPNFEALNQNERENIQEIVKNCLDAFFPVENTKDGTPQVDKKNMADVAVNLAIDLLAEAQKSTNEKETTTKENGKIDDCKKMADLAMNMAKTLFSTEKKSTNGDEVGFENIPELAVNAAIGLFSDQSPGGAADQLKKVCVRLLSECSVDSSDSDFILFEGPCHAEDSEDDWSEEEYEDEEEKKVREACCRWDEFYGESPPQVTSEELRQVKFDPNVKVRVMRVWDSASRAARPGPWEQAGRDRVRFLERIVRTEPILSPILTQAHRVKIMHRMEIN